jgi:porin
VRSITLTVGLQGRGYIYEGHWALPLVCKLWKGIAYTVNGAPSNRNLIDFEANAGVVLKGPFKGRDNDSVGVSVGYVDISPGVVFANNTAPTTPNSPVPSGETVIEATDLRQVTPW